jgi:electron transfer flavoprotein beta subunit
LSRTAADAIHGSDTFATSLELAEAIKKLDYDPLVFGMTSTDAGMGVVPTLVAERLDLPAVTFDGDKVTIRRDGDVAAQRIEATGKVVASVTDQTGEARYRSFNGIMAATKKDVQEWTLSDLGVYAAAVA